MTSFNPENIKTASCKKFPEILNDLIRFNILHKPTPATWYFTESFLRYFNKAANMPPTSTILDHHYSLDDIGPIMLGYISATGTEGMRIGDDLEILDYTTAIHVVIDLAASRNRKDLA